MRSQVIGSIARKIMEQEQGARLLGITSRGIFVHTDSDWVLFLSGETYRGPLTINFDELPASFLEMAPGDPVSIYSENGLWFPKRELRVTVAGAKEWSARPCERDVLSPSEIRNQLEEVAGQVRSQGDVFGDADLADLSRVLQTRQAARIAAALSGFLGLGVGLTPAGDDLATGLLLVLNRWQDRLFPDFPIETLNALVIADARRKTTSLSTNLIACAAQGQADERLILGLDGLVTGEPDVAACTACFNSWGNTSGASAFIGMRLALETYIIG